MKIIVADDEILALKQLVSVIKETEPEAEITPFQKPEELLNYVREHSCDVAFLDVEMGSMTGIEVAKQLKTWHPKVNLIFVTGYGEYAQKAIKLRASGYLMKPATVEEIREELDNLRNPMNVDDNRLAARCFGTFDVFWKGKSIDFERNKTKEMLAYLIHRKGSSVTSGELRAVLWKDAKTDENTRSYLSKVQKDLVSTLKRLGLEDVLNITWGKYAVNTARISCDYYDYLNDKPEGVRAYNGEYMSQYSWGEAQNVIIGSHR